MKKCRIRFLAGILCVLLVIFSLLSSGCALFEREAPSKDQLSENITRPDGKWSSVARYLYEWEFPTFNDDKFLAVEQCVEAYYCGELPTKYEMAKTCADLFVEHFYDKVDLYNRSEVTDALLTCYMASFGDGYAAYRNASAYEDFTGDMSGQNKFVGIGIRVRKSKEGLPYVLSVINGSPAEAVGIKRGDVIISVDDVIAEESGYEETVDRISGPEGESVSVTIRRQDELITLKPNRRSVADATVLYSMDEATGYGLIEIVSFKEKTAADFKEAIDALESGGAEGIIFDLRNNLGGMLESVVNMISYLVDDSLPVVSYKYNGKPETKLNSGTDGHAVKLPMVVLVNEYTASAAEIFTAALRDYELMENVELDVTIVGKNTFGKGVMQRVFAFPDGSAITVTVAYYNPPLGVNYHGIGVAPDVTVEDDLSVTGGDAQLKAAFDAMSELVSAPKNENK